MGNSGRRYTADDKYQMNVLRDQGMTLQEIAEKLGTTRQTVFNHTKRRSDDGITVPPGTAMHEIDDSTGVATYLGVSTFTLNSWRTRRVGPPYIRMAGAIRYRRSDVDEWLKQNTVNPGDD
jgi:predicted DNA-binding transcriptional regulator AlpA